MSRLFAIVFSSLVLAACGEEEHVELAGQWRDPFGEVIDVGTMRNAEGHLIGRLSGAANFFVREHAFGGFAMVLDTDQTIMPMGGSPFVLSNDQTFCRACELDGERIDCHSVNISINQFGVKVGSADFDCHWTKEAR